MTWKEAQQAFKDKVPVVYNDRTVGAVDIVCPYIYEIALRRMDNGEIMHVVGAMDKNMNCVYKNTPEHFTRR